MRYLAWKEGKVAGEKRLLLLLGDDTYSLREGHVSNSEQEHQLEEVVWIASPIWRLNEAITREDLLQLSIYYVLKNQKQWNH